MTKRYVPESPTRIGLRLLLFAWLLVGAGEAVSAPFVTPQVTPPPGEPADGGKEGAAPVPADPAPKFTDESLLARFREAVRLFEENQWKPAEKLFRACEKRQSRETRKVVRSWRAACQGGAKLDAVDRAVGVSHWKKAWVQLERVRAKYGETPLRSKIEARAAIIEQEIFLPLANFESPPAKPEGEVEKQRPAASKPNSDPRFVRQGKRSLRWDPGKIDFASGKFLAWLPLAKIDGKALEGYKYLRISLYATEKAAGRFTLFFGTGQAVNMNVLQTRCYYKHIQLQKPGWHDLRIDLRKGISSYTNPEFSEIELLSLMVIPPANPKRIYIDDVKLEKK